MSLSIRPYQAGDEAAVYDICVRTGDDGQDATGRLDDVQLLADIWAGPYLFLEPDLAFVLDDGERPVGYVLGTADTATFVESYRKSWLPRFSEALPARTIAAGPEERQLLSVLRHPERMLCPELTGYPAHLHIDILPCLLYTSCTRPSPGPIWPWPGCSCSCTWTVARCPARS